MKIWIDSLALEGPHESLLWPGALFGLTYLQQHDHACSFAISDLSEDQQQLLHNETIQAESFDREEADATITAQSKKLLFQQPSQDPHRFDNWIDVSRSVCFPRRTATHKRQTAETDISIDLNLDGTGKADIDTGLSFFDHMLEQIAKHGLIDLKLHCDGDLEIDEHHTIEDVAIALGTALTKALGDKTGISRYAFALPMDESQATVLLDLSGRPYLVFEGAFTRDMVGDFPTEMTEHFFYSLAMNLKATLHVSVEGKNDHHKIEACFKAFARCIRAAITRSERNANILPSTKDLL